MFISIYVYMYVCTYIWWVEGYYELVMFARTWWRYEVVGGCSGSSLHSQKLHFFASAPIYRKPISASSQLGVYRAGNMMLSRPITVAAICITDSVTRGYISGKVRVRLQRRLWRTFRLKSINRALLPLPIILIICFIASTPYSTSISLMLPLYPFCFCCFCSTISNTTHSVLTSIFVVVALRY